MLLLGKFPRAVLLFVVVPSYPRGYEGLVIVLLFSFVDRRASRCF
jgi:hypothetical protein